MSLQPLAEIPINAYIAWCPAKAYGTILALGVRHMGVARLDFAALNVASLPYMKYSVPLSIKLGDTTLGCLSWSPGVGDRELGILATGFHDGVIHLWDPSQILTPSILLNNTEQQQFDETNIPGRLAILQPETGDAITCMEFNVLRPSLIACGHASGGLQIINAESMSQPEIYDPGAEPVKAHGKSSVTCVSWNQTVQHIMASTCANGSTAIWNLKQRKASIIFRDPAGRTRVSSVAWLPNQATQVVVSYDTDTQPSLQMWDLRNTSYPFKEFQGHGCGVTEVQFSPDDPSLMLSCGKDNRITTWSMSETGLANTPAVFSEIPTSQWQISARWSPCLPGLIAASSHAGGVIVDSVERHQNTQSKHVAAWNNKPCGGSFGFAANFVYFSKAFPSQLLTEVIPSADPEVISEADRFEECLKNNDEVGYCESKIKITEDPYERLVWKAVETLFCPQESRNLAVLDCLNYDTKYTLQKIENFFKHKPRPLMKILEENASNCSPDINEISRNNQNDIPERIPAHHGMSQPKENNSLASDPNTSLYQMAIDAESFFNRLGHTNEFTGPVEAFSAGPEIQEDPTVSTDPVDEKGRQQNEWDNQSSSREFSASLGNCKPDLVKRVDVTHQDDTDWSTGKEALIKECFLIGEQPLAIELCVEADRWVEALLLAAASGDTALWSATAQFYFQQKEQDKFLQLVKCILTSRWKDLVQVSDLYKWSETLALIASYAPPEMFSLMCEDLGSRLENERCDIRSAVVCYLLAGSVTRACRVWGNLVITTQRGKSEEKALQDLVEKMTILMRATRYQEYDILYNEKASQYADVLANSGRLTAAMKFLCLISHQEECASSFANVLRDRIYFACPEAMRLAGITAPSARPFNMIRVEAQNILAPTTVKPEIQYNYVSSNHSQSRESQIKNECNAGAPYTPSHHGSVCEGRPSSLCAQEYAPLGRSYQPIDRSRGPDQYMSGNGNVPHLDVNRFPQSPAIMVDDSRKSFIRQPHLGATNSFSQIAPSASSFHPALNNSVVKQGVTPPLQQNVNASPANIPPTLLHDNRGSVAESYRAMPRPYDRFSHAPIPNTTVAPPLPPKVPLDYTQYGTAYPTSTVPNYAARSMASQKFTSSTEQVDRLPSQKHDVNHLNTAAGYGYTNQPILFQNTNRPRGLDGGHTHQIHSTAPAAGVTRIPQGMPVPWPIPTGTQQVASATSTTAPANQKIHVSVNPPPVQEPMPQEELEVVQRIILEALELKKRNDTQNAHKVDDFHTKISEMFFQLQQGSISRAHQLMLTQFCYALRARDISTATHLQGQLTRLAWTKETRVWLMALKHLL